MNTQELNGKSAILYARASTQEQSTKVQLEQLEKFCNENGIKIIEKFKENVSGAKEHREQLEIILNSEPKAELLIIREISRISREKDYMAALEKIRLLVQKYSIYVLLDDYFIKKGEVIDLATGITMMVKLYGAAEEREKIKDRTSAARDKYRKNPINVATGTKYIPFGLMKADNPTYEKGVNTKKIWVKNPDEWTMVERIFQMKCEGYSLVKISQITGVSLNIVQQTIKNPKIRYYMPTNVLEMCDKATEVNNTNPSPTKHTNLYKNKIFCRDTNLAMVHQCSNANGNQYRAKKGESGTIKAAIIDDAVKRTIIEMMVFFDLKKQELAAGNEEKIKRLESEVLSMMKNYIEKSKQEDNLNRKYINAPSEAVEKMITEEIKALQAERNKMFWQIEGMKAEINRLRNIDYSGVKFVLTDANFPDFVDKYIRRIECWHLRRNYHLIKVFVQPDYIPDNFYDYKQFEVMNYKHYTITEKNIPDAAQTVYSNGGFSWDCKVLSIPYYTPEQIEEMFGKQN